MFRYLKERPAIYFEFYKTELGINKVNWSQDSETTYQKMKAIRAPLLAVYC